MNPDAFLFLYLLVGAFVGESRAADPADPGERVGWLVLWFPALLVLAVSKVIDFATENHEP